VFTARDSSGWSGRNPQLFLCRAPKWLVFAVFSILDGKYAFRWAPFSHSLNAYGTTPPARRYPPPSQVKIPHPIIPTGLVVLPSLGNFVNNSLPYFTSSPKPGCQKPVPSASPLLLHPPPTFSRHCGAPSLVALKKVWSLFEPIAPTGSLFEVLAVS